MEIERGRKVYFLLAIFMIMELAFLFIRAGVIYGVSSRAEKLRAYGTAKLEDLRIIPGDIYDRNGRIVVESGEKKYTTIDEKGKEVEHIERYTKYNDARAYSQLVGYTGLRVLNLMAESAQDVVGERDDYRLMRHLDDEMWAQNGIYGTVNSEGKKGTSAVLTVDSNLQNAVYGALCSELDETKEKGAAVVLDVRTGEILAMVAFPTYDFNDRASAINQMAADAENKNLEPTYPVSYKNAEVPGSIFKVLMSVALIDHGMEDFEVPNETYTVNEWTCNSRNFHYGDINVEQGEPIDLTTALISSSNVYFTKAALSLGPEALNETAEKFMLSEKTEAEQSFMLDCGSVPYSWNLNVDRDVLAQTGMGQGCTEITTLHAAMIAQAIANDGKMLKPYVIKQLVNANDKIVYEGTTEVLSEATSKETADKVAEAMRVTAQINSKIHGFEDVKEVFEEYQVAGKTGTGEVETEEEDETVNNAWYISFAPADDPQYAVAVSFCRTDRHGYEAMPVTADIYRYLFEEY